MKEKVLEIIATANIGGGSKHLLYLLKSFPNDRYEPVVMCSDDGPLVDDIKKLNIKVELIDIFKYKLGFKLTQIFRDVIRKNNINYVHLHGTRSGYFGGIAAVREGIKSIYTAHVLSFNKLGNIFNRTIYNSIEKKIAKMVNKIITVSYVDRDILINKRFATSNDIVTINNGVDFNYYQKTAPDIELKKSFGIPEKNKVITMVARFVPQKGIHYFIQTASEVIKTHPDTTFVLVGDGFLFSKMKELVRDLNLKNNVKFLGIRKNIKEILSFTDIFLLTSLWEGLPLTLLEAMSMSIPVISSEVNGTIELIKNGVNGYLVKPGNVKGYTDRVRHLLQNPYYLELMGNAGRLIIEERYGIQKMIDKTYNLYFEVFN
ncbi:MAG: glycosyltransferase family 4 protein [bacterium]|nr:glycosyltransferase family 4 protein [bacterium]